MSKSIPAATESETAASPAGARPTYPQAPATDETCLRSVEQALDCLEVLTGEEGFDTKLTTSVVIPVYNERETICQIVERVRTVAIHDEILIVDDCSTDGTRELLEELAELPDVRVLFHPENRGKGAALRTAFACARGDVILIQDADLEYDPADYPRLLAPIEQGEADVVYGSRFLENACQDPSWIHRIGNRVLTRASNWLTGQELTDMETCYKVIRREFIEDLELCQDRFGFEPEITAKLARYGARITEVPIRYHSRGYEEGKKIGVRDGLNAVYCIARYGMCD